MNKKITIFALLSFVSFASLGFVGVSRATLADGEISFDTKTIQALSHKDGETINFLNDDMVAYWDNDATDIETLKTLYEMNDEIASFPSNSVDHEYTRNLYDKWDDFKPVNNTLSWKSTVNASSYDIVVSTKSDLTEALYEEKGLTEPYFTMENPFASTHYFWQVTSHTSKGDFKSSLFDFYSGDYKRTVDIPTISNTRDVGGFTGQFGTMKQGLVFRSGRLDDCTELCREALNQLDIQTDLDLRRVGEGRKNPANLPNYMQKTMQSYYADFSDTYRAATVEAVRVFAEPANYPIIFHCAVGRDRTGTLGILLQALCGASREYIIHDYYSSMFSVTGAYQKTLSDLNLYAVNDVLNMIEGMGDSLSSGAENFLKEKVDASTGETIGLSELEIEKIRDIWSGKIEVEHGQKTFKASDNYEGKVFVKIKSLGHEDVAMMVDKGATIKAPYQLDDSLMWLEEGKTFDFASSIQKDTFIYADYAPRCIITIHFVGIAKPDEILTLKSGDVVNLSQYTLDGFDMVAISDQGEKIDSYNVTRDAYINVVYTIK